MDTIKGWLSNLKNNLTKEHSMVEVEYTEEHMQDNENLEDLEQDDPEEDLMEIDKRIEAAMAAQSQLVDQSELQSQAEQLPELLQKRERMEFAKNRGHYLDEAIEVARGEYDQLGLEMPEIREQFTTIMDATEKLAQVIMVKQEQILSVGVRLSQAVKAYKPPKCPSDPKVSSDIPEGMSDEAEFEKALVRAGGTADDLGLLPPGVVLPPEWVKVLHLYKAYNVYSPRRGVVNFKSKF
jgi:hypothetical protein